MVVLSKRQSVTTANAKGSTSILLMDIVAFLESFNVRLERRGNPPAPQGVVPRTHQVHQDHPRIPLAEPN